VCSNGHEGRRAHAPDLKKMGYSRVPLDAFVQAVIPNIFQLMLLSIETAYLSFSQRIVSNGA